VGARGRGGLDARWVRDRPLRTDPGGVARSRRCRPRHSGWVALPEELETSPPSFQLARPDEVREVVVGGAALRVLVGEMGGIRSPIATCSPVLFAEASRSGGGTWKGTSSRAPRPAWTQPFAGSRDLRFEAHFRTIMAPGRRPGLARSHITVVISVRWLSRILSSPHRGKSRFQLRFVAGWAWGRGRCSSGTSRGSRSWFAVLRGSHRKTFTTPSSGILPGPRRSKR